jgi:hypothetical protein
LQNVWLEAGQMETSFGVNSLVEPTEQSFCENGNAKVSHGSGEVRTSVWANWHYCGMSERMRATPEFWAGAALERTLWKPLLQLKKLSRLQRCLVFSQPIIIAHSAPKKLVFE